MLIPAGTLHTSLCKPDQSPSWFSAGSYWDPCSWSNGCALPWHLPWSHSGSCTLPELQPNTKESMSEELKHCLLKHVLHLYMNIYKYYLLQLIDVLCLLDVELKNVQDTSMDIQHCFRDSSGGKYLTHNTLGILKLDGNRELSSQGWSEFCRWDERIVGPHTTVLKDLRVHKLQEDINWCISQCNGHHIKILFVWELHV